MEELLQQILSEVKELKHGQAKLEQSVTRLEQGFTNLEQKFNNLEQEQTKLEQGFTNLEQRFVNLEQRQTKLEQGQQEILLRLDKVNAKLDDLEVKNADNHVTLFKEIKNLRKDFTVLEAVAGKNLLDIAHLKAANN